MKEEITITLILILLTTASFANTCNDSGLRVRVKKLEKNNCECIT